MKRILLILLIVRQNIYQSGLSGRTVTLNDRNVPLDIKLIFQSGRFDDDMMFSLHANLLHTGLIKAV